MTTDGTTHMLMDPLPSAPAITVRHLTKRYRGAAQPSVSDLDLTVHGGEIFGLIGPNGAGKTTTLSLLSTILAPDRGRINICGIDCVRQPGKARRLIGVVPQNIALYPTLTAWENLTFFARLHGVPKQQTTERVSRALSFVGLASKAHQKIAAYSGGMKRRANIAAGLVHAPRILFLDEPTVGIDPQSRQLILDRLRHMKDTGTTVLYTTHYMEEAQQLCDRVAVMDGGRMLLEGTPTALLATHDDCADLGALFLKLTGKQLRE